MSKPKRVSIDIREYSRRISGLVLMPNNARALYVFGHGAGAGMSHPFMESMARNLAERGIASLRYQFPYMEEGKKRPDQRPLLLAAVRSALREAHVVDDSLPLFAGGKSMGGRMTSLALAEEPLAQVRGIVFLGFPLHPPEAPSTERALHLSRVALPMLFLQGTRDKLASLKLLEPVIEKLGRNAALHIVEGGDHSFHIPKSSGRSDADVLDELSEIAAQWMLRLVQ